ncbi:hypothetical protein C5167_025217 [Papaver somniferum]|uniref:Uncharacterized protein n=1 Tax=Papaver somniferum TaxID=3469 RepID=A0A4Y7JUJ5_PAPSO|nr:hypothetical protein C5167_025217 [Papaver somniferum]
MASLSTKGFPLHSQTRRATLVMYAAFSKVLHILCISENSPLFLLWGLEDNLVVLETRDFWEPKL